MSALPAGADRRRLLIDTARAMFTRRPYDQVTTTEIAKQAGVAYGLIAHHFDNKRGLYLAVMNEIAAEISAAQLTPPPAGATLAEQLRHALHAQITHIDGYADSFAAFIRGHLGTDADADQPSTIDALRWLGAQRILLGLGIVDPISPVLRTAMRGWVGYLDEMMIDRITHGDTTIDALVELAAAALVTTLRTAVALDPTIPLTSDTVRELAAPASSSLTGLPRDCH